MALRRSGQSDGPTQVHQHGTPKSPLLCPRQAVRMIHGVQRVGRNKGGPEIGVHSHWQGLGNRTSAGKRWQVQEGS